MQRYQPKKWRMLKADSKMTTSVEKRMRQRAVIQLLAGEGCAPIDIRRRMFALYVEACMDFTSVRRWEKTVKDNNPATTNFYCNARRDDWS